MADDRATCAGQRSRVARLVPRWNARFRRNGDGAIESYVRLAMTYAFDTDMTIARRCLRAGRLHSGE